MRHTYRVLSEADQQRVDTLKDTGLAFIGYCNSLGSSRELSLAITKMEEAVMWSVKHVTK